MKITEDNFISQIKKRNEKALDYVIDNYSYVLKTIIKKHLNNLQDYYEECMNDCLLAIWDNIHYYDPKKSSFKNWIAGIAKYKSINYIRKYLKNIENKNIENISIPIEDNGIRALLEKEVSIETEKMLESLSEKDRDIFKKLYLEDKSFDEISKDTGLSKAILYNRVSRGKRRIRNEINKVGGLKNEEY